MSHNAHTGARMISKPANDKFESGWDRLWGNKARCQECGGKGYKPGGAFDPPVECGACSDQEPAKELTEAELEHWAEMMGHGSWEDLDD